MVIIGSATAEIFLIWTNVTMTNVAWKHVAATIVVYSHFCVKPRLYLVEVSSRIYTHTRSVHYQLYFVQFLHDLNVVPISGIATTPMSHLIPMLGSFLDGMLRKYLFSSSIFFSMGSPPKKMV